MNNIIKMIYQDSNRVYKGCVLVLELPMPGIMREDYQEKNVFPVFKSLANIYQSTQNLQKAPPHKAPFSYHNH